jgi:regulator of protease activity HflC (stomatin/prohibitin superfamily)
MPASFDLAIVFAVIGVLTALVWLVSSRRIAAATHDTGDRAAGTDVTETPAQPANDPWGTGRQHPRRALDLTSRGIHHLAKAATIAAAALVVVLVFSASATVVSTKNVGIVTSFGRPEASLGNGFHLVAPWQQVTEMDAAIQTDSYTQESNDTCIDVRIAHQAIACVDASIRWRIQDNSAPYLFQNYRNFDHVRDSLVTRELNASLNAVLEDYDPLAVNQLGDSTAPPLRVEAARVTTLMRQQIGAQIDVLNVIIPVLHFDDNTQGRIQALQAQIAQTRIAIQARQTAEQQALANKELAASVSHDPNVLVNKCLDLENEMIAKGQTIPPNGIGCWPGSGSPLIVSSGQGTTPTK